MCDIGTIPTIHARLREEGYQFHYVPCAAGCATARSRRSVLVSSSVVRSSVTAT